MACLASVREGGEDALQSRPVELDHRADELLDAGAGRRVLDFVEPGGQLLDSRDEGIRIRAFGCRLAQHIPVGVCITFRTPPLPSYMCTPHGRHGSKLRTARMMSTPLKFSGPFSSKIGVFCTASS